MLTAGTCSCNAGFFYDSVAATCASCGPSCATCDDATKCKTCPAGETFQGDTCTGYVPPVTPANNGGTGAGGSGGAAGTNNVSANTKVTDGELDVGGSDSNDSTGIVVGIIVSVIVVAGIVVAVYFIRRRIIQNRLNSVMIDA